MNRALKTAKANYDCPKCGESFNQGQLANRIRNRRCCSEAERFWVRVQKGDGCWLYTGAKLPKEIGGYGWVSFGGKRMGAHRVSWLLTNGPIPPRLHVLHKCDNGPCCNPEHLFLGTHDDNMADMIAKGRNPRGERNNRNKLTEVQALEIKKAYRYEPKRKWSNAKDLAKQYGVGVGAISAIASGRAWSHIGGSTE